MLQEIEQEQQKLKEIEQEQQTSQKIQKEKQKFKKIKKEKQKSQKTEKEKQTSQETEEEESSENEDHPAVKVGLLNVRSIKNKKEKRLKIKDLITENNLDVFLLTETWLENDSAAKALSETVNCEEFLFRQESRVGRGGGVAILFSQALEATLSANIEIHSLQVRYRNTMSFESITTFEYVITALRHKEWDEEVLFINVYRPPKQTQEQFNKFVDEFTMLLNMASKRYNSIIVAGDFNLKKKLRFELVSILHGFVQHVQKSTHEKGGILDLVFSRNVEVFRVYIQDKISDHLTVYFSVRPPSKDAKTKANPLKKEE